MAERKVVFVINHASFFVSHRLPVALAAQAAGYRVSLITGQAASASTEPAAIARVREAGIVHHRAAFTSSGMNPLREIFSLLQITRHLLRIRPDVVHCASPKGVMYGGVAARLTGVPVVVLAISGMGYAFTDGAAGLGRRIAAGALRLLGRVSYGNPRARIVVQNKDDEAALAANAAVPAARITLVPGSGVDLDVFPFVPMSQKAPLVLFPGRVIRDKGIAEFVAAARSLQADFPQWRFVVVGAMDYANPSAVGRDELAEWTASTAVEFLGHVDNLPAWMAQASIVCLPSYREGMPKVLLEAAATGSAVVTTDVVGCREAVVPGVSGLLVPVRDAAALTEALRGLMVDMPSREALGLEGRKLAESRFAMPAIVRSLLALYTAGR
jgi:glycosyltransferase involved in cell wall biosynthesis